MGLQGQELPETGKFGTTYTLAEAKSDQKKRRKKRFNALTPDLYMANWNNSESKYHHHNVKKKDEKRTP